jgi:hypothetical protein
VGHPVLTRPATFFLCETSGSHSGEYEDGWLSFALLHRGLVDVSEMLAPYITRAMS